MRVIASALPREALIMPARTPRRMRLLIVGETPARHKEAREQARLLGAAESISVDGLDERAAREQLQRTPVDRVLVLGPLHTLDATKTPALTYAGRQAARYLRGAFPVRWCPGDGSAIDLSTMPESPADEVKEQPPESAARPKRRTWRSRAPK